jgi:hypothetical protein
MFSESAFPQTLVVILALVSRSDVTRLLERDIAVSMTLLRRADKIEREEYGLKLGRSPEASFRGPSEIEYVRVLRPIQREDKAPPMDKTGIRKTGV